MIKKSWFTIRIENQIIAYFFLLFLEVLTKNKKKKYSNLLLS